MEHFEQTNIAYIYELAAKQLFDLYFNYNYNFTKKLINFVKRLDCIYQHDWHYFNFTKDHLKEYYSFKDYFIKGFNFSNGYFTKCFNFSNH